MNLILSTSTQRYEKSRWNTQNEDQDAHSISRSKTENKEERIQRRRHEWERQQELEKQHEKLKQQKILEYERKRAQTLRNDKSKS